MPMPIPEPRGPVSAALVAVLTGADEPAVVNTVARGYRAEPAGDVLTDDDAQLALTLLYELHLHGVDGADDGLEWAPELIAARAELEAPFEAAVRDLVRPRVEKVDSSDVVSALWEMTAPTAGPGLSGFMAEEATESQFRELLIHRSLNQLREADVHTLGIPRLAGHPKAALVEVQADEYGGGRLERMHSQLFATTMRELGLSHAYAHYLDDVPAVTLASLNVLSLFGLHRRLRAALAGHLCAVETTSALPSKKYSAGLRRLGFGVAATRFFDEHVEADSVHEQIVVRDLAGGLVEQRPDCVGDVLLGAAACLAFDDLVGDHMADAWGRGASSLRVRGD